MKIRVKDCGRCPFFYTIKKEKIWYECTEDYLICFCSYKKKEVERSNPEWCPLYESSVEVYR